MIFHHGTLGGRSMESTRGEIGKEFSEFLRITSIGSCVIVKIYVFLFFNMKLNK